MAWIPKGKELKRIRNFVGWTRKELAKKSKVGLRTIAALESDNPPPTMRVRTLDDLSDALTTAVRRDLRQTEELRTRGVPPDALATWDDGDPVIEEDAGRTAPTHGHKPARPAAGGSDPGGDAPRKRSLSARAAIERKLGQHAETVQLPSGIYPLLGADRLLKLDARFAEQEGHPYVVSGKIREFKRITGKPARVLKAERGFGAIMVCIERTIAGTTQGHRLSTTFYMTVFAPKGEHGRRIMEMEEKGLPIAVLTRVVVRDYDEKNGWNGFFVFEDRPHPWPFALVVEDVFPASLPSA